MRFYFYFFSLRHGWKIPVGFRGPKNIVSVAQPVKTTTILNVP